MERKYGASQTFTFTPSATWVKAYSLAIRGENGHCRKARCFRWHRVLNIECRALEAMRDTTEKRQKSWSLLLTVSALLMTVSALLILGVQDSNASSV